MLLAGSILSVIAQVARHHFATGKLRWLWHRRKSKEAVGGNIPWAKKFLTLDLTHPNSGATDSVGLYLMPQPAAPTVGVRAYGATIIDHGLTAHSARFITDGRNCLIVFADALATSIAFQMKPWSRRIAVMGTLPDMVAFSNDNGVIAPCVQQLYAAARSIVDADRPKTRSDINRIRRRVAKLLHPDLGSTTDRFCRASAMARMNAELDEIRSSLAV